jgi:hypothetical protein
MQSNVLQKKPRGVLAAAVRAEPKKAEFNSMLNGKRTRNKKTSRQLNCPTVAT